MFDEKPILIAFILISVVLVAYVIVRPGVTVAGGGKVLAFVVLLVFPVMAGSLGTVEHLRRSTSTEFCLSCHIMDDYGKSLHVDDREYIPALHYQNNLVPRDHACYTCHTDYAMFGDVRSKARGLRHVYVNYFGTKPETIKLYTAFSTRECLHCHLGMRAFEEGATHNQDPTTLPKIKANQLACTSSGCHSTIHNVKGLKDVKLWEAPVK